MSASPALADRRDDESAQTAAPKPPSAEDIATMMEAAEQRARARNEVREARRARSGFPVVRQALVTAGLVASSALLAGFAFVLATGALGLLGMALGAVAGVGALFFFAAAFRPASAGFSAPPPAAAGAGEDRGGLAGAAVLKSLGLAERVLESDPDARLITRNDGVVLYANAAYFALAREAGVLGRAGLPPRIDRLFAQQGAEATKVFRLCRAAKSAASATEIVYQQIGLEGGGVRRRFEVSTRPVGEGKDIVWRLRELPVEENEHDALAASYADYLRPVFALERSGQIAWANAAMRKALGVARHELHHIDDAVLGETGEIVRALARADSTPVRAEIRRRDADPIEATFSAFRRGGVGEGFVVVDMAAGEEGPQPEDATMSGDVSEAPFGLAVVEGEIGRDARIVETNKMFCEMFSGVKKNSPLGRILSAEAIAELAEEIRRKSAAPQPVDATVGDGPAARSYGLYARPLKRRRGGYGVRRTFLYAVDVSDRKRMEDDHAQDQKLKAIGYIAGGVAHDFNNLLQVIQGNCEHLMLRHPPGDPAYQDLVLIRENAQRAANLTKQLLAYSRKQTLTRKVQSITDILLDFSRFLDRAVGEKVKIELINGRGLPDVKVDRNQLETAIMNLAVNARDAMAPSGGRLTIRTRLAPAKEIEPLQIAGLGVQDHVIIEIADTGPGVPEDIRAKIFDPFFTTKEEGKGTGLGLSTVHGIIGQMGGAITVENASAGGALFKIYLPAWLGGVDEKQTAAAPPTPSGDLSGSGRILVVEDEDPVRAFVVATLERSGYEVSSAEDGVVALHLLKEDRDFDLVVSDVMMPEIDGPTMIERARAEFGLKAAVIFMSGYAEAAVREQMDAIAGARYIQKPFPMAALGACVKESLQERQQATQRKSA